MYIKKAALIDEDSFDAKATASVEATNFFVHSTAATTRSITRPKGLLLTKDQLVKLMQYVSMAQRFPDTLDDCEIYLGYGEGYGAGQGLGPKEMLAFFKTVSEHANSWEHLHQVIVSVSDNLKIFAQRLIINVESIEAIYKRLDCSRDLKDNAIESMADWADYVERNAYQEQGLIRLSDRDHLNKFKFDEWIKATLQDQQHEVARFEQVQQQLNAFQEYLLKVVVKIVSNKLKQVKDRSQSLPAEVESAHAAVIAHQKTIDELSRQYDEMVTKAIESASTLSMPGILLSFYTGYKADEKRREINKLTAEQVMLSEKAAKYDKVSAGIIALVPTLNVLKNSVVDAKVGATNLKLSWNSLGTYLNAASVAGKNIGSVEDMIKFMSYLKAIKKSWESVEAKSDDLLDVFREADEEFLILKDI